MVVRINGLEIAVCIAIIGGWLRGQHRDLRHERIFQPAVVRDLGCFHVLGPVRFAGRNLVNECAYRRRAGSVEFGPLNELVRRKQA